MAIFLGFMCFAIAIGAVIFAITFKPKPVRYNRSVAYRKKERATYADTPKYRELLSLVGGNRATADRLISAYGVDKAIIDLERDRRIN